MAAKLLSGYTTAITGVINFPAGHPGAGYPYLILNGNLGNGGFAWQDSQQGTTHSLRFAIPWENIGTFRQYCLAATAASGGSFVRTLPMQSPFIAAFPGTYAIAMSGQGDGSDASVTDSRLYSDCICEVSFSTIPYGTEGPEAFIEVNYGGSADYTSFSDAKLQFASSGEPIERDAGVLVGQLSINITYHKIPDPNAWIAALMPLKGKVNSEVVVIDGFSYDPGHLLFPTFDLSKAIDSFGARTAQATIPLLQRDIPWNSGITSEGVVDDIVVEGTTTGVYETADLNGMFA